MTAPKPVDVAAGFRIVLEDAHVVIIEKPSGISSVPYERKETGTAMDLIRAAWRRAGKRATVTPLYIVHRIDKDTSGLLCFAKTRLAERALHVVFQRHMASRAYLAVAEGEVDACGSNRTWSPTAATASAGPPAGQARDNTPSRTSSHCAGFAALHYAGCASKPGAHIKSVSTWLSAATRWSARPFTSATSCARGASHCRRRASCCTRRASASATRSPALPSTSRRRRPRISYRYSNRWEGPVATP